MAPKQVVISAEASLIKSAEDVCQRNGLSLENALIQYLKQLSLKTNSK